ncbi:MAG TPA: trigger factor [Candidatus Atribacteria bacterium]|nr:trigger factor [Candidatus Atribacteria bacterium]
MVEVKKEEKERNVIEMEITVEKERVDEALDKVYRELSYRVNVPGFRRGKAPRAMLRSYAGEDFIMDTVAQDLIPQVTREVLTQENLKVIGEPELEVIQAEEGEPLVFRLQVVEEPEVKLADPRELEVRKYRLEIRESDVEKEVEKLIDSHSTWKDKGEDEPAREGDLVMIKIEDEDYAVVAEASLDKDKSLTREVLGMKVGDKGKIPRGEGEEKPSVEFSVSGIMGKERPEVNQEFLSSLEEGLNSIEDLKAKVRERLEAVAQEMVEERLEKEAVVALCRESEVYIPEALLDIDVRRRIDQLREDLEEDGLTLDRYLELIDMDFATLEKNLRDLARWEFRRFFVLEKYAEESAISVTEEDLAAEYEEIAKRTGRTKEEVKRILEENDRINEVKYNIKEKKALKDLAQKVRVKELEEPINLDQWRALEDPEEEVIG